MNRSMERPLPARIALLPQSVAAAHLTTGVLRGTEAPPHQAIDKAVLPIDGAPDWTDPAPLSELLGEAMVRFEDDHTQGRYHRSDAWLAPRLHATLRLTRREAADPRLWAFLALRLAPDYVFQRHPAKSVKDGAPQINRAFFTGPFHKQAFSRLWWAAELFRDGADYRPVEIACANQTTFNTTLRYEIVAHRPTAQALTRLMATEARRTREAEALVRSINTAGSTLLFEAIAPDEPTDPGAYRDWQDQVGRFHVPYDLLPEGPDDGEVPEKSVNELVRLFGGLYEDAPIRGRASVEEGSTA